MWTNLEYPNLAPNSVGLKPAPPGHLGLINVLHVCFFYYKVHWTLWPERRTRRTLIRQRCPGEAGFRPTGSGRAKIAPMQGARRPKASPHSPSLLSMPWLPSFATHALGGRVIACFEAPEPRSWSRHTHTTTCLPAFFAGAHGHACQKCVCAPF